MRNGLGEVGREVDCMGGWEEVGSEWGREGQMVGQEGERIGGKGGWDVANWWLCRKDN